MYTTERALLLKRVPYGESSLVVQALTPGRGRVHFLAKGAYRLSSNYFGLLDLFDTLELTWNHRPQAELQILRSGNLAHRRQAIPRDLDRYRAGLSMLELAEVAAQAEQQARELFAQLEHGLDALALRRETADLSLVVFELGFLQNLGLMPALEGCAACAGAAQAVGADEARAADIPDSRRARTQKRGIGLSGIGPTGSGLTDSGQTMGARVYFSAGAGGRLCKSCALEARAAGRRVGSLPLAIVTLTAQIARRSRAEAPAARPEQAPDSDRPDLDDPDRIERVRDLVERFIAFHLEAPPRSQRRFLAVPNRNAP